MPPIVTKCNEASSNLGDRQVTSPEAPGNQKKPLSGGAGTQYPPYKAKLNVEQLTKQSLFPSNKPV
ncbi:hypothetical protein [Microcoleus sp. OTE_8_concoct_300]|uniref:hypothetical protein n=1 Tax=Microcoleus sp. OTE_8_concoct_300 TaxID=2964710 RepID=UPI00403F4670